ncbi:MAG: hypothetical protein JNN08_30335 [Bryobacterales bacterium]|nr:hypothetical protein [Bryobacterales bacterium]
MKKLLVAAAVILAVAVIPAKAGLWDPGSPHYWREIAQGALLNLADRAPNDYVVKVARLALQTHPQGVAYVEMEKAAHLFNRAGEKQVASALWLALARLESDSGSPERAEAHAVRARDASGSERAYLSGVLIHRDSPAKRTPWIEGLRVNYPNHEIARAFGCLAVLQSFEHGLPAACDSNDWIGQKSRTGIEEYVRISREIEHLPQQAAQQMAENQQALARLTAAQAPLASKYHSLGAQLAKLEKDGHWEAAGTGLVRAFLPLPEPGDTFETWIAREGVCALPLIRWFCRAGALADAFAQLQKQRQNLIGQREAIAAEWRQNETAISSSRSTIAYWQSTEPLDKLIRARNGLLLEFRADVEKSAFSHYTEIGIKPSEAVTLAIGATDQTSKTSSRN